MIGRVPFSDLPAEILQEVFFWCLPTPANHNEHLVFMRRETFTSPAHAPLLLCHVCRHWRDIALSSPNLWATLSVIVRLGVAIPASDLATAWLSRSGALPLNLALYQQNESSANCAAAARILEIFEERASQWGSVRFELSGPHPTRAGVAGGRAGPSLRDFRLYTSNDYSEEDEEGLFSVFNHAPHLRSLHTSRIPRLDISGHSSIPVPWTQFTHLSLDYLPAVGTALHILHMCPSLESCNMKVDTARGSVLCHTLQLPKLHTLSINLGFESLACFLDHLVLPHLFRLTVFVRGPLEQYRWAQEQFDAFLTRSTCHIHRLEIHDTGMTSSEFASCLRHPSLQSLRELVIDDTKGWTWDPFITPRALDLLTDRVLRPPDPTSTHCDTYREATSRHECFLPLLKRLTIRGNCFRSPDGTIADMVESRCRSQKEEVVRLQFVEVDLPMDHVDDTRRLKELQGDGLEVVFSQQY
ncbi:hypothetical protein AN958_03104 [Leucoagaricus sp. SymC.cos]|nr:hypothetical protein AN958_03104 [Leucoagaricus sp. SymC.cos]